MLSPIHTWDELGRLHIIFVLDPSLYPGPCIRKLLAAVVTDKFSKPALSALLPKPNQGGLPGLLLKLAYGFLLLVLDTVLPLCLGLGLDGALGAVLHLCGVRGRHEHALRVGRVLSTGKQNHALWGIHRARGGRDHHLWVLTDHEHAVRVLVGVRREEEGLGRVLNGRTCRRACPPSPPSPLTAATPRIRLGQTRAF
ncbi:unnamed protein product [Chondrus crispus]|uniref:Uncharacterized protein n=1 Tax=Chondrus crispus TaxID=2769 RepID=R7QL85_CHOCR|nr:unnamed protein product [Chondrus crispus]CDF38849.1 unnamed protein product [Chondrus crispus]|eukprot:XP_005718754.1 unnamed protein product [Chondrus crispus]